MALSGIFYGTTSNPRLKPQIVWSAVQSPEGNYSDVTASLQYTRSNSGYTTGGTWTGTLTIGDETVQDTLYMEITYGNVTTVLTHTARIYHDSYGKATITISATGGIVKPAEASLKTTTISEKVELDTIPRASTVSAVTGDIGSRTTVVVSRKNDSFTHSIAYSFGELSGYIDEEGNAVDAEVRFSNTILNFLLPNDFYGQIPNSPTGECTLTCRTYSGSDQIGQEQPAQFTVRANQDTSKPEVSGTVVATDQKTSDLTGSLSKLVSGLSVARCTIHAEARNEATISTVKIGEETFRDLSSKEVDTYIDIVGISTGNVVFQATDSRDYPDIYEHPVDLVPYKLLTNNAYVQRTDPTSGNAVLTLDGTCWKGNFGEVDNTLTAEYQIGSEAPVTVPVEISDESKYSLQIPLSGLEYTKSHTITVTVRDEAMEVPKTLTVHKGIPVFDWGEEDFRFNVPVELPGLTVNGQTLEAYIRSIVQGG